MTNEKIKGASGLVSYDYICANGKKTGGGGASGPSGGPSYNDWFSGGGASGGVNPPYTPIGGDGPVCLGGCNSSACSGGDNGDGGDCN